MKRAANILSGYSATDLVKVAQRAKMISKELAGVSYEYEKARAWRQKREVPLTWAALLRASALTTPSALLLHNPSNTMSISGNGAFFASPTAEVRGALSWDDFCAPPHVRQVLTSRLFCNTSSTRTDTALSRAMKGRLASGAVLYGPSGCGKTFLGAILCSQARSMGFSHISRTGTDLLSKYFGGSEERVRNLFSAARQAAPCLLFIDDFDVISSRRSTGDDDAGRDVAGRILSTFLNELDGVSKFQDYSDEGQEDGEDRRVVVVVATPSLQCLDEALLRPGRLQLHVELPSLAVKDTVALLDKRLSSVPGGKEINTAELSARLHASSVRDSGQSAWRNSTISGRVSVGEVVQSVERAVRGAIRRSIQKLRESERVLEKEEEEVVKEMVLEARDFDFLPKVHAPLTPSHSRLSIERSDV